MKLTLYQIDAFADDVFSGNPAAVCYLENWLDDAVMQTIATENNLSETAFFVAQDVGFHLRWFTPKEEVDLCGHATLATAYVIFKELNYKMPAVEFETRGGKLVVTNHGNELTMNFPKLEVEACCAPELLKKGLGLQLNEVYQCDDYIVMLENEDQLMSLQPDFFALGQLDIRGIAVTAPGRQKDFVSRFFAPKHGINEDPVTGSVHCALAPLWQTKLNKNPLQARQLSRRGGDIKCECKGDRVYLSGKCAKYMTAEIEF